MRKHNQKTNLRNLKKPVTVQLRPFVLADLPFMQHRGIAMVSYLPHRKPGDRKSVEPASRISVKYLISEDS